MVTATTQTSASGSAPVLLAPAGDPDCGYAAFQYGADAVYTGLRRFSARAEAVNLDARELGELAAYAHTLRPRRRVFLTLNTLTSESDRHALLECLDVAAAAGVDALIIQDLGVLAMARRHVPHLELHASTQLAIHNLDGARRARDLGFAQVTLARELTLDEIRAIAADAGLATEVFIHGALCYAYSGLCQYSALRRGRSGNRGQCGYPCRDRFRLADGRELMPFSMKDLALGPEVRALAAAGVRCLKIEGRKKSALYVAAATRYYRGLLDGTLSPAAQLECERDLRTIFSRPWTRLNLRDHRAPAVTDPDVVGHRGDPVGRVLGIHRDRQGTDWLRCIPDRPIERHDGLQIELPGWPQPYGFGIAALRPDKPPHPGRPEESLFEAPAGRPVRVALPPDHPPLPTGAPIALASAQAVKRRYPLERPKPGAFRPRLDLSVTARIEARGLEATAALTPRDRPLCVACRLEATLEPRRGTNCDRDSITESFMKLGDTQYRLSEPAGLQVENPTDLFVPVSLANRLRRDLTARLDEAVAADRERRLAQWLGDDESATVAVPTAPLADPAWIVKTDQVGALSAWLDSGLEAPAEFLVDIGREAPDTLLDALDRLARRHGGERIRLALPLVWRAWETARLEALVRRCLERGWRRWECAGLAGPALLSRMNDGRADRLDLSADWPLYALNREAIGALTAQGFRRFTFAPEDTDANMLLLARAAGERAVLITHRDPPLFIAAHCTRTACADTTCPAAPAVSAPTTCHAASMTARSSHDEDVTILSTQCRTIVLGRAPERLPAARVRRLRDAGCGWLRLDFLWRDWSAPAVTRAWQERRG